MKIIRVHTWRTLDLLQVGKCALLGGSAVGGLSLTGLGGHTSLESLAVGHQPTVKPLEELTLPQHAVLRLLAPVVLVGEQHHACGQATQFGGIEGLHGLGVDDAEVVVARGAHDGGVPVLNIVGGVAHAVTLLSHGSRPGSPRCQSTGYDRR